MKIHILRGSPQRNGSSNLLADRFICGARESGHSITETDTAHAHISPCTGCKACGFCGQPCSIQDDMQEIKEKILAADMLVFVTPLYNFGMSAQLKICLDRCCAIGRQLTEKHMNSAMIVSAWNDDDWTMDSIESHYLTLCRYLDFENAGTVLGTGCGTVEATAKTMFPQMAYELGRSLLGGIQNAGNP